MWNCVGLILQLRWHWSPSARRDDLLLGFGLCWCDLSCLESSEIHSWSRKLLFAANLYASSWFLRYHWSHPCANHSINVASPRPCPLSPPDATWCLRCTSWDLQMWHVMPPCAIARETRRCSEWLAGGGLLDLWKMNGNNRTWENSEGNSTISLT